MVILERNTVIQPVDFLSVSPFYVSESEIMTSLVRLIIVEMFAENRHLYITS